MHSCKINLKQFFVRTLHSLKLEADTFCSAAYLSFFVQFCTATQFRQIFLCNPAQSETWGNFFCAVLHVWKLEAVFSLQSCTTANLGRILFGVLLHCVITRQIFSSSSNGCTRGATFYGCNRSELFTGARDPRLHNRALILLLSFASLCRRSRSFSHCTWNPGLHVENIVFVMALG